MKIDISALKKKPFERERIQQVHAAGPGFLELEGYSLVEPLQLDLEIEFTGRTFILHGQVATRVQAACSRCLRDAVEPIKGEFNLTMSEPEFKADFEGSDDVVLIINDEADLTRPVYEALLTAVPVAILCRPDCRGLCPSCGRDLNTEECQCRNEDIDPRWARLAQLNTRRKDNGST